MFCTREAVRSWRDSRTSVDSNAAPVVDTEYSGVVWRGRALRPFDSNCHSWYVWPSKTSSSPSTRLFHAVEPMRVSDSFSGSIVTSTSGYWSGLVDRQHERDVDDLRLQRVRLTAQLDELAAGERLERDVAARPLLDLLHPWDGARRPGDVEAAQARRHPQHGRLLTGLCSRAAAHQQARSDCRSGRPDRRQFPSHRDLLIESTWSTVERRLHRRPRHTLRWNRHSVKMISLFLRAVSVRPSVVDSVPPTTSDIRTR